MTDKLENKLCSGKMKTSATALDPEWMGLVVEAMNSQVSKEEFKDFIEYHTKMKTKVPSLHTHKTIKINTNLLTDN